MSDQTIRKMQTQRVITGVSKSKIFWVKGWQSHARDSWEMSNGWLHSFCGVCGLYVFYSKNKDFVLISTAIFANPSPTTLYPHTPPTPFQPLSLLLLFGLTESVSRAVNFLFPKCVLKFTQIAMWLHLWFSLDLQ